MSGRAARATLNAFHWNALRRQQTAWTGAVQKRFAWALGYARALVMFLRIGIRQAVGPVNLLVCAVCLVVPFFETAPGICNAPAP